MNPNDMVTAVLQTCEVNLEVSTSKICMSEVFRHSATNLNEDFLFIAHFNTIPNIIIEENIDCRKANEWFLENYRNNVWKYYYIKRPINGSKHAVLDDIYYLVFDDLLIYFDTNSSEAKFLFSSTDELKVQSMVDGIRKFTQKRSRRIPRIHLLIYRAGEIRTKSLEITKPKLSIEENYNDDFKEVHETIFRRLSRSNDKGMILLHGKPGTGKTSYIRYLVASLKKDVIFLPPNMATALTNPDLLSILMDNTNSVLVIEDAENIIIDREKNGGSPVSALLNISDGLLSDCLNIQIICSFNTDLSKVDPALIRKGRLIAKYEFGELDIRKAQKLSDKLGFNRVIDSPMTLASIYNQNDTIFRPDRKAKPIGFRMDRSGSPAKVVDLTK